MKEYGLTTSTKESVTSAPRYISEVAHRGVLLRQGKRVRFHVQAKTDVCSVFHNAAQEPLTMAGNHVYTMSN
jgi:hypothetical protein